MIQMKNFVTNIEKDVDILLIDDIQFHFRKKKEHRKNFFHTFNTLHGADKQIIISMIVHQKGKFQCLQTVCVQDLKWV